LTGAPSAPFMPARSKARMMSDPTKENPAEWEDATRLVRGGLHRSPFGETSEALYLTQGYVYDSPEQAAARFAGDEPGYVYSRYANPTVRMFEERMALLEGAEACRATASGMAAVHLAMMGLLRAGDHVVAGRAMFGSCRYVVAEILPRFGVETTFVDGRDLKAWEAAVRPNTKVFFFESPANPLLELVDIAGLSRIAKPAGVKIVVDNVFATPIFQKPLKLGADIVVYSATKHVDGQGRVLGGAVLGSLELLEESYKELIRHTGPTMSAFNAWVMLKGLETLELRVRQQAANALALAEAAVAHPAVRRMVYPWHPSFEQYDLARAQMSGGGTVVGIEVADQAAAFKVLNALQIIDLSNNLGDAKSLVTHPWTTTHRSVPEADRIEMGLTPGTFRLSVGLEGIGDLTRDLTRALDQALPHGHNG
jgi:O-succinylhomoserine sulfhydrylase